MVLKYSHPLPNAFQTQNLIDITLAAHRFKSKISIRKGRIEVDPKSFIETVGLLRAKGNRVEITAEGEDADKAVETLMELAVGSPV